MTDYTDASYLFPTDSPIPPNDASAGYEIPVDDEFLRQVALRTAQASRELQPTLEQPGLLGQVGAGFGAVAGAQKHAVDWGVRKLVEAAGGHPEEGATTGSMLRAGLGLAPSPEQGYAGALAGRGLEFATDIATDPLTWELGGLGRLAGTGARAAKILGRLGEAAPETVASLGRAGVPLARLEQAASIGRVASPLNRAAGAAFAGSMGLGAFSEGKRAYEDISEHGLTPQGAEAVLGAGLTGAAAGLGAYHTAAPFFPKRAGGGGEAPSAPPEVDPHLHAGLQSLTFKGELDPITAAQILARDVASKRVSAPSQTFGETGTLPPLTPQTLTPGPPEAQIPPPGMAVGATTGSMGPMTLPDLPRSAPGSPVEAPAQPVAPRSEAPSTPTPTEGVTEAPSEQAAPLQGEFPFQKPGELPFEGETVPLTPQAPVVPEPQPAPAPGEPPPIPTPHANPDAPFGTTAWRLARLGPQTIPEGDTDIDALRLLASVPPEAHGTPEYEALKRQAAINLDSRFRTTGTAVINQALDDLQAGKLTPEEAFIVARRNSHHVRSTPGARTPPDQLEAALRASLDALQKPQEAPGAAVEPPPGPRLVPTPSEAATPPPPIPAPVAELLSKKGPGEAVTMQELVDAGLSKRGASAVFADLQKRGVVERKPGRGYTFVGEGPSKAAIDQRVKEILADLSGRPPDAPPEFYGTDGRLLEIPEVQALERAGKLPKGSTQRLEDWQAESGHEGAGEAAGKRLGVDLNGRPATREELLRSPAAQKRLRERIAEDLKAEYEAQAPEAGAPPEEAAPPEAPPPPSSPLSSTPPKSRRVVVEVEGKKHEVVLSSPAQVRAWDDAEATYRVRLRYAKARGDSKGAQILGLLWAAEKRRITGVLTRQEQADASAAAARIRAGDIVTREGVEYRVLGSPVFGKVKVEDANGTVWRFDHGELEKAAPPEFSARQEEPPWATSKNGIVTKYREQQKALGKAGARAWLLDEAAKRSSNPDAFRERAGKASDLALVEQIAEKGAPPPKPPPPEFSARQEEPAPTFYSHLERVASKVPQAMSGADLQRYLAGKGVKADEMKWTGLDDFLKEKGKVTPGELRAFVAANKVEVQEVTKGGDSYVRDANGQPISDGAGGLVTRREATKFSGWQTPGGENYRELLLTLPAQEGQTYRQALSAYTKARDAGSDVATLQRLANDVAAASDPATGFGKAETGFRGGHYDEPNVLAHVRFNERTDAAGKRVLFIEEVQSDWAQKGRREGFGGELAAKRLADAQREYSESEAAFRNVVDGKDDDVFEAALARRTRALRALEDAQNRRAESGVVSAPFVGDTGDWSALAMKRMIRYAAENGFDKVAWTTGEQQAARYDLSKHVDEVTYRPDTQRLLAFTKNGDTAINKIMPPAELADAIGKEAAERLLAQPLAKGMSGVNEHVLTGEQLKVGGEGMKGFYDKIMPAVAGKLGKKWGAKVGETVLDTGNDLTATQKYTGPGMSVADLRALAKEIGRDDVTVARQLKSVADVIETGADGQHHVGRLPFPEAMARFGSSAAAEAVGGKLSGLPRTSATVHALDITPEMRASVPSEGFPLFSKRGSFDQAASDLEAQIREVQATRATQGASPELENHLQELLAERQAVGERWKESVLQRRAQDFGKEEVPVEGHPDLSIVNHSEAHTPALDAATQTFAKEASTPLQGLYERLRALTGFKGGELGGYTTSGHHEGVFVGGKSYLNPSYHFSDAFKAAEAVGLGDRPDVVKAIAVNRTLATLEHEFLHELGGHKTEAEFAAALKSLREATAGDADFQRMAEEFRSSLSDATVDQFRESSKLFDQQIQERYGRPSGTRPSEGALQGAGESGIAASGRPQPRGGEGLPSSGEGRGAVPGGDLSGDLGRVRPGSARPLAEPGGGAPENNRSALDRAGAEQAGAREEALRDAEFSKRTDEADLKLRAAFQKGDAKAVTKAQGELLHARLADYAETPATVDPNSVEGRKLALLRYVTSKIPKGALAGEDAEAAFVKAMRRAGVDPDTAKGVYTAFKEVSSGTSDPREFRAAFTNALQFKGWKGIRNWLSLWKAGMFGVPTHVANTVSNGVFIEGLRQTEQTLAGVLDAIHGGITGAPRTRYVVGEAAAAIQGHKRAFGEAWPQFKATLTAMARLKGEDTSALETRLGKFEEVAMARLKGPQGKAWEFGMIPAKALGLADDFAKHFVLWDELSRTAYRTAKKANLSGDALWTRVNELSNEYAKALVDKKSPEYARHETTLLRGAERMLEDTFQADLGGDWLGKSAAKITEWKQDVWPLELFFPFTKAPANIAKQALMRTPYGFRKVYKAWKEGKYEGDPGRIYEELAKPMLGSIIMSSVLGQALAGNITGQGSSDPKKQLLKRETGWQPYSIKVGDKYIPYNRVEPLSSLIGMAADIAEGLGEGKHLSTSQQVKNAMASIQGNLTNKTFLQGLEGLSQAWNDPVRYGGQLAKQLAGSVVPNVVGVVPVASLASATDPYYRKTSIATASLARIPGVGRLLPPQYGPLGEERERPGTGLGRLLLPSQISNVRKDVASRVAAELDRIDFPLERPRDYITLPGKRKLDLTPTQYAALAAAQLQAVNHMNRMIQDKVYQALPDTNAEALPGQKSKEYLLRKILDRYRGQVVEPLRMRGTAQLLASAHP